MEWSFGDVYAWLVFGHLAALLAFVMSHGISVGVLFALRRPGTLERTRNLLDLSTASFGAVYVSALAILVFGISAGVVGGRFTFGPWWLWISLGLFVLIAFYMGFVRWNQMTEVRHAAGLQLPDDVKKGIPAPEPQDPAAIAAAVERVRPWLVLVVGFGGLLVILLLMMFKPI